jgi:hypothetical protein
VETDLERRVAKLAGPKSVEEEGFNGRQRNLRAIFL